MTIEFKAIEFDSAVIGDASSPIAAPIAAATAAAVVAACVSAVCRTKSLT